VSLKLPIYSECVLTPHGLLHAHDDEIRINRHHMQACNQDFSRGVLLGLVGDHSSGGLGEQPPDVDNNLIFGVL